MSNTPKHYAVPEGGIQHKDYCAAIDAPYFEGCASKYVTRYQKKGGVEDLKKALQYIKYRLEAFDYNRGPFVGQLKNEALFEQFIKDNNIPGEESDIIDLILHWKEFEDLEEAMIRINDLIDAEPEEGYVNQD